MEVIVLENSLKASELVANRIQNIVQKKSNALLGFATGASPLKVYEILVERYKKSYIDFKDVKSFNLDEYVGLSGDHPASYLHYMNKNLFSHINIRQENCHIPNGLADNIEKECEIYENLIKTKGPIDLQILGIGRDGHIGFNEPISSFQSRTRLKTLTQQTRKDNAQYFKTDKDVPFHVITMGIASILDAKEIILIAFGQAKAKAIMETVEGPLTSSVPASALQFHAKVKIIIDEEAASLLKNREYYDWVYKQKPLWQKEEFK
jgi:glucosamine-6-phosphate deaminase